MNCMYIFNNTSIKPNYIYSASENVRMKGTSQLSGYDYAREMKRIIDETEHNQLDADDVIVLTTHLKGERYKNAIIFFKD